MPTRGRVAPRLGRVSPGEDARDVTEPKQYQMQKRATKHLNFAARCMKRRGRLL